MKVFLSNSIINIKGFLAKYNIPFPIAAFVVVFVLIFLITAITLAVIPSSSQPTKEYPLPTQSNNNSPSNKVTLSPSHKPLPSLNPEIYYKDNKEYIKSVDNNITEEQMYLSKDKAVASFMDSLPYQGAYIRATYSISDNSVHIVLNKSYQAQANEEFDTLLKRFGVQTRTWIPNLIISTE